MHSEPVDPITDRNRHASESKKHNDGNQQCDSDVTEILTPSDIAATSHNELCETELIDDGVSTRGPDLAKTELSSNEESNRVKVDLDATRRWVDPSDPAAETWMVSANGSAVSPQFASAPTEAEAGSLEDSSAVVFPPNSRLGQYQLLGPIGKGSMGVVYKAYDPTLRRHVAIKILSTEGATNSEARHRFVREAQSAAAIHHEHVVPVYAVENSGPRPFLVMKYIEGRSLDDKIRHDGPLAPTDVIRMGIQIASGLAEAHAHGLIHRDIKPGNILLEGASEKVLITDFGLARAVDDASLTQHGVVAGTPLYMSPEQASGASIDHRADLFSLGSVLYAMCVGRPPFQGDSTIAVIRRVCDESPRSIVQIRPRVPIPLSDLISRLHAKDPAARPQSALEVVELLRHIGDQHGAAPSAAAIAQSKAPLADADHASTDQRRRWLTIGIAVLLLAVTLGFTETTGITRLSDYLGTMLHIRTPRGTLLIEVDDPNVRVTVEDGGKEITIKGAGLHEFRLRPGSHSLRATKDGVSIREELVSITRNGKTLVRVTQGESNNAVTLTNRSASTLHGHSWAINAIAFVPDGTRIASASGDKTVKLWDIATKETVATLTGHENAVFAVAFSPDGRTLATAGWDHTVRLWDAQTGASLATLSGHTNWVWCLAFSRDGASLASGSADTSIKLWDIATRKESTSIPTHAIVRALVFSPSGKSLVAAYGSQEHRNLVIWNIEKREINQILEGHPGGTVCLAFAPDGKTLISGGNDRCVVLWDTATWTSRLRFRAHTEPVYGVAVSPDGTMLATGEGDFLHPTQPGLVKIWDASTSTLRAILQGHEAGIYAVEFAPDGKSLATGSGDWTTKLWNLSDIPAPESHRPTTPSLSKHRETPGNPR